MFIVQVWVGVGEGVGKDIVLLRKEWCSIVTICYKGEGVENA